MSAILTRSSRPVRAENLIVYHGRHTGLIGAYVLVLDCTCSEKGGGGHYHLCHCPGIDIRVYDGRITGEERIEGRYYVTCSVHGTRTYYRGQYHGIAQHGTSAAPALDAAKTCTFCRECRALYLERSKCPMCGKKGRGCAMCSFPR